MVPADASEERKLATVLFADLVGSTELGGSQDPERTRALLDRFYEAMADEVERAGGTTDRRQHRRGRRWPEREGSSFVTSDPVYAEETARLVAQA
jgi:class 3 adenylate cyclase